MSVTQRQRRKRWLVWEVDYPDEGSTEVRARTANGARVAYLRTWGSPDATETEELELGMCPLTPGLEKIRARGGR